MFDLAAKMNDPINLSIGQPDFDVPEDGPPGGHRGDPEPQERLFAHARDCRACARSCKPGSPPNTAMPIASSFVTSGTSGGLVLAMLALVNPGDEVIVFDPYFVMYEPLVKLVGGVPVADRHLSRLSRRSRPGARGDHAAHES